MADVDVVRISMAPTTSKIILRMVRKQQGTVNLTNGKPPGHLTSTGADPGFLGRGFKFTKGG